MSGEFSFKRVTAPDITKRKGGAPIVALTAYHALGIGELSDAIQQAASGQDGGAQIEEAPGEEEEGAAQIGRAHV